MINQSPVAFKGVVIAGLDPKDSVSKNGFKRQLHSAQAKVHRELNTKLPKGQNLQPYVIEDPDAWYVSSKYNPQDAKGEYDKALFEVWQNLSKDKPGIELEIVSE